MVTNSTQTIPTTAVIFFSLIIMFLLSFQEVPCFRILHPFLFLLSIQGDLLGLSFLAAPWLPDDLGDPAYQEHLDKENNRI